MRDIAIALFVLAMLPLALRNSFVAVLMWCWAGLIGLNTLGYGFMSSISVVQIFAIIALAGMLLRKEFRGMHEHMHGYPMILVLMILHGFFCALLAYPGLDQNWTLFTNMLKTALVCLVLPVFLTSRERINFFILIIACAISYHGVLDGLKYLASAGGHNAVGIAKFGDNNHYGMMLVMVIPLWAYLYQYAVSAWMRLACVGGMFITFMAVLATNSRGALITVILSTLWLLMFSKRKLLGAVAISLAAVLAVNMAPDQWFARMDTIKTANEDASFMGRVTAWKRASAIALENPVFGGGYHAGQAWSIFEDFRDKPGLMGGIETPDVPRPAASHSIYFEVMGDLGFVGLALFLMCVMTPFYYWRKILSVVKTKPEDLVWARSLAVALTASMMAYLVGGAALSVAYYELPYYIITAIFVLYRLIDGRVALKITSDQRSFKRVGGA